MEPLEFAALERLARSRGSSVADMMREAVRLQFSSLADQDRRAKSAQAYLNLRDTPLPAWAVLKDELESRRDADIP